MESQIQLAYDDEGVFHPENLPASLQGADLGGMDRENSETISEYVDSVFSHTVARNDYLQEILTLLLNNQEGAPTYSYCSSATGQIVAEQLGLPKDVLELIPFAFPYQTGPLTDYRPGWFKIVISVINFFATVWGGLVALGNFLVQLFTALIEWGMKILQAIGEALLAVLEAIFKAIIILFMLIELVINLLMVTALVLLMGGILALAYGNSEWGFLWIKIYIKDNAFIIEEQVENVFVPYLDLSIPVVKLIMRIGDKILMNQYFSSLLGVLGTLPSIPTASSQNDATATPPQQEEELELKTEMNNDPNSSNGNSNKLNLAHALSILNGIYPPELTNPVISPSPSTPILTPSTTDLDIEVNYRDLDNEPPEFVKVHFVYDNGMTKQVFYTLRMAQKDPSENDYDVGVTYELCGPPVELGIPGGAWEIYFSTTDGGIIVELDNNDNNYDLPYINEIPSLGTPDGKTNPSSVFLDSKALFYTAYTDDDIPMILDTSTPNPDDLIPDPTGIVVKLVFNEQEYNMVYYGWKTTSATDIYLYYSIELDLGALTVPLGDYQYHFTGEDKWGNVGTSLDVTLSVEFDWGAFWGWFYGGTTLAGAAPIFCLGIADKIPSAFPFIIGKIAAMVLGFGIGIGYMIWSWTQISSGYYHNVIALGSSVAFIGIGIAIWMGLLKVPAGLEAILIVVGELLGFFGFLLWTGQIPSTFNLEFIANVGIAFTGALGYYEALSWVSKSVMSADGQATFAIYGMLVFIVGLIMFSGVFDDLK